MLDFCIGVLTCNLHFHLSEMFVCSNRLPMSDYEETLLLSAFNGIKIESYDANNTMNSYYLEMQKKKIKMRALDLNLT